MTTFRLPDDPILTKYVKFIGGLDQVSPVLSIAPGNALDAMNYEPGVLGGYKRIDGYERFDGHTSPSSGTYYYATYTGSLAVSDAVTGVTSGATGVVVQVGSGAFAMTKVTGTFVTGETLNVSGLGVAALTMTPLARGYADAYTDAVALAAAADKYRADIAAVPGSGPVRGVWMYNGTVYAFRNNAGGTAGAMYKSTAAGWVLVALGREMQIAARSGVFTVTIAAPGVLTWAGHGLPANTPVTLATTGTLPTGLVVATTYFVKTIDANTFKLAATSGGADITTSGTQSGVHTITATPAQISEGDTVTGATSGATGVVTRAALRSGAWTSSPVATLTFATVTGTFNASEALTVGGVVKAGTTTADTAITLVAGGRFEFENFNFSGSTSTYRMYGCDGVNKAFEFDGTVFVPIRTGMTADTPNYIRAHKKKLFLGFKGSLQNSSDNSPYQWSAIVGASEIGMGDDITGLLVQTGDVLAIFTRNGTSQLQGSTVATFNLAPLSPETGAIARTAQNIGMAYALDDRGIIQIRRTQAYGNFNQATVSNSAQTAIDALRSKVIASTVYGSRNQYRIYGNDGSGVIMTVSGDKVIGITKFQYPVNVTCACAGEDSTGKDVVFFGDDSGYVYQADKGSSFDGADIEAYVRIAFNNIDSPRFRKRFRKAVLEMSAVGYAAIRFQPEFSYGDPDIASHPTQTGTIVGAGGYWDVDYWEQFFWDAQTVSNPEFSINGTGLNMSTIFYSKSAIDLGHTLQGMLVHYSIRRLSR